MNQQLQGIIPIRIHGKAEKAISEGSGICNMNFSLLGKIYFIISINSVLLEKSLLQEMSGGVSKIAPIWELTASLSKCQTPKLRSRMSYGSQNEQHNLFFIFV